MGAARSKTAEGFVGAACETAERRRLIAEAAYYRAEQHLHPVHGSV